MIEDARAEVLSNLLPKTQDIVRTPSDQVEAIFADFTAPGEANRERGGHPTTRRPLLNILRPDQGAYAPNYHCQSSFSPDQDDLVKASHACLSTLIQGIRLKNEAGSSTQYRKSVKYSVRHQDIKNYKEALLLADTRLLSLFVDLFPQLVPAMEAALRAAAIAGFVQAINGSATDLLLALKDELTPVNLNQHHLEYADPASYRGPHHQYNYPRRPTPLIIYEDICTGQQVARLLMEESKWAAIELSTQTRYRARLWTLANCSASDDQFTKSAQADLFTSWIIKTRRLSSAINN